IPKAAAFEFASLGGAVDDVWYTTTQTWFDRQADLRDTLEGRSDGSKPGLWLKMVGNWDRRTQSTTFVVPGAQQPPAFVFNTSFDQDTAALIGGLDLLSVTDKDRAWVVGIQGGTLDSSIRFRASPDRFHVTGTDIGGYATWLDGGLFVDGQINANFMK